jgi:hypothetical protein
MISRMLSKQINKVLDFSNNFQSDDLSQNITVDTKDEIGQFGSALNIAKDTISSSSVEIIKREDFFPLHYKKSRIKILEFNFYYQHIMLNPHVSYIFIYFYKYINIYC